MPQASESLRQAVGHYDPEIDADIRSEEIIRAAGINITPQWIIQTKKGVIYSAEVNNAINYLLDEWDYDEELT